MRWIKAATKLFGRVFGTASVLFILYWLMVLGWTIVFDILDYLLIAAILVVCAVIVLICVALVVLFVQVICKFVKWSWTPPLLEKKKNAKVCK